MSKAKKAADFNKLDKDRPADEVYDESRDTAEVLREDRPNVEGIAREAYKAAAAPEKVRKVYDEKNRAMRVLASQGRGTGMVDHLPEPYMKRLAALSDEHGTVQPAAPTEFQKILRELIDEHKAVVKGLEPNE